MAREPYKVGTLIIARTTIGVVVADKGDYNRIHYKALTKSIGEWHWEPKHDQDPFHVALRSIPRQLTPPAKLSNRSAYPRDVMTVEDYIQTHRSRADSIEDRLVDLVGDKTAIEEAAWQGNWQINNPKG